MNKTKRPVVTKKAFLAAIKKSKARTNNKFEEAAAKNVKAWKKLEKSS